MKIAISPSITSNVHTATPAPLVSTLINNGHEILDVSFGQFPSSEIFTQLRGTSREDIKDEPLVLMSAFARAGGFSASEHLHQAVSLAGTWKRYGGGPVWLFNTFGPFARGDQERPDIEAKGKFDSVGCDIAAQMLALNFDGISTIEIHSEKAKTILQKRLGNENVITLDPTDILAADLQQYNLHDPVVISPDKGANARADELAKRLGADRFCIDKKRNVIETTIVGFSKDVSVKDRDVILVDDMADSIGTADNAIRLSKQLGAARQFIAISHPIWSDPALQRMGKLFDDDIIERAAFCNTINRECELSSLASQYSKAAKGVALLGIESMTAAHIAEIAAHPIMQAEGP